MAARVKVFTGHNWLQCEPVDEVGTLTMDVIPRVGELIEVREAGQLIFGFPVQSVRHTFDKGKHRVELLCVDDTPIEFS